ncbi:hypothetical protein V8F06_013955 [Rhypophila decipiens]
MALPYAIIFPLLAVTATAQPMDGSSLISPEMSISSANNICPNKPTHDERVHCMCNIEFLDTLQGCQAELADCFQKKLNDDLEPAFSAWHDGCDKYITLPPVTKPATTTTTDSFSYDEDFCLTAAKQACESAHIQLNQCSSFKTDPGQFSTCMCDPRILRNEYTCEILLATRCLGISAAVTDMSLSAACDNFESVVGTGLPDAATTTIHLSTTTTPALEPATPIGTTPTIPLSTTPPTPMNGAARSTLYGGRATVVMVLFVLVLITL